MGSIVIPVGVWCEGVKSGGHFLVRRLLTLRLYNFEALWSTLLSVMNLVKDMQIRRNDNGRFLF